MSTTPGVTLLDTAPLSADSPLPEDPDDGSVPFDEPGLWDWPDPSNGCPLPLLEPLLLPFEDGIDPNGSDAGGW